MSAGEYARRHPTDGRPRSDIAGDNCARADDGLVPDAYRTEDDGVRTDHDVVADDHATWVVSSDVGSQASVVLELPAGPDRHVRMDDDPESMVV
jgi:hypothetical protein